MKVGTVCYKYILGLCASDVNNGTYQRCMLMLLCYLCKNELDVNKRYVVGEDKDWLLLVDCVVNKDCLFWSEYLWDSCCSVSTWHMQGPHTLALLSLCRKPSNCFGCASAAVEHCITLLRALVTNPNMRQILCSQVRACSCVGPGFLPPSIFSAAGQVHAQIPS